MGRPELVRIHNHASFFDCRPTTFLKLKTAEIVSLSGVYAKRSKNGEVPTTRRNVMRRSARVQVHIYVGASAFTCEEASVRQKKKKKRGKKNKRDVGIT